MGSEGTQGQTPMEGGFNIAEDSERPIALVVPEVRAAMGTNMEPVAENDVGVSFKNRLSQREVQTIKQ